MPIVALVEFETLDCVQIFYSDGKNESHMEYDLFFADDGEELTEFEKELNRIVTAFSATHAYMDETEIHHYSKGLLDLARKEILEEFRSREESFYKNGFERGRESALKDLPKWNKAADGEYYLTLEDLETLPKEE